MSQNQFARPQIVAKVIGLDSESQEFYFKENSLLIKQSISENERLEKLRRIKKSPTKEKSLTERFGISLTYPSAYKTVKDTTNFVWIQKEVRKLAISRLLQCWSGEVQGPSELLGSRGGI